MSFLRTGLCPALPGCSALATLNWRNKDLLLINRIKCACSSSVSIWPSARAAKRITLFFARISNELCFMGCEMKWCPLGGLHTQMCPLLCPPVCVCVCKRKDFYILEKTKKRRSSGPCETIGSQQDATLVCLWHIFPTPWETDDLSYNPTNTARFLIGQNTATSYVDKLSVLTLNACMIFSVMCVATSQQPTLKTLLTSGYWPLQREHRCICYRSDRQPRKPRWTPGQWPLFSSTLAETL